MEDSEEAAIRSCHQEPTRRNIIIAIACIKTLQLESFTMLTSCICILENMSFPAESVDSRNKGKNKKVVPFQPLCHTCQMCDHHTRWHPNCLAVYIVKKLQRNNKKQYLWCSTETKKWYHPTSMPYMLNESLSHQRTPNLSCSTHSGKSCKVENENSIHGAELKQNSMYGAKLKQNNIHGAQLIQKRQGARQWKMNFCFLSEKEEQ